MKHTWMLMACALLLTGTLTACGSRGSANDRPNGETNGEYQTQQNDLGNTILEDNSMGTNGNNVNGTTGSASNGNVNTGTGTMDDGRNSTGQNADTRMTTQKNNNANTKRTSSIHRSAYDYLNDGRYVAGQNGKVYGKDDNKSPVEDLTQGARDMIRGAADAARRAGNDVENTVRNGVK